MNKSELIGRTLACARGISYDRAIRRAAGADVLAALGGQSQGQAAHLIAKRPVGHGDSAFIP